MTEEGRSAQLGAGLPLILQHHLGFSLLRAYQLLFLGYSELYLVVAGFYLLLSSAVEISKTSSRERARVIAPQTKKVIGKLIVLFALDSFGGGFLRMGWCLTGSLDGLGYPSMIWARFSS